MRALATYKYLILLSFTSGLSMAGIQFEKITSLPSDLRNSVRTSSLPDSKSVLETNLSNISFKLNTSARYEVELPGAKNLYQAGMPVVPTLNTQIISKEGFETEVVLLGEEIEKSVGSVAFEKTPLPLVWGEEFFFPLPKQDGIFPGKFLKTDSENVQIFPVQQDLKTGEVFVLKKSSVWVRYVPKSIKVEVPKFSGLTSLIVTSKKLESSAKDLAQFQKEKSGLRSLIVFVEDIQTPEISEGELPDGYKNGDDKNEVISPYDSITNTGYNYSLSRKIISYLKERMTAKGSRLRYVTILGNAELVPPSYYFTLPATFGKKWGVTDQCYSSIDNCLKPKVALGRLPFSSNEEVQNYIKKAENHLRTRNSVKNEINLVGGKAFPNSEIYVGELGTLRAIQDPTSDWNGVGKIFRTKFSYSKKTLLSLARGQFDSKFVYALDHGKGNQWFVEHEFYTSDDIERAVPVENPNTPIVVSIACSNAAFDEAIVKEPVFADPKHGNKSVGKALLMSKGGAVAYWGEVRPGLGNPVYKIDLKGNLDLQGSTYGLQLLEGFFDEYRKKRQGRMGDMVIEAQRNFAVKSGNNMAEQGNAWTYYITTLLGDPTLPLPPRPEEKVENYELAESKSLFEKGLELPVFNLEKPTALNVDFFSPKEVNATLFKWEESEFGAFLSEKVVAEKLSSSGNDQFKLDLIPEESSGSYFLRLENARGVPRERQVWFKVQP